MKNIKNSKIEAARNLDNAKDILAIQAQVNGSFYEDIK